MPRNGFPFRTDIFEIWQHRPTSLSLSHNLERPAVSYLGSCWEAGGGGTRLDLRRIHNKRTGLLGAPNAWSWPSRHGHAGPSASSCQLCGHLLRARPSSQPRPALTSLHLLWFQSVATWFFHCLVDFVFGISLLECKLLEGRGLTCLLLCSCPGSWHIPELVFDKCSLKDWVSTWMCLELTFRGTCL